jgi:hypothetical protein
MIEYARCHSSARAWPVPAIALGLLLAACTPSSPEREPPAESIEAPPEQAGPERAPPSAGDACGQQITEYLSKRAELSRCEADSDCSEMWPGLCPHGPYYIHRDADVGPIVDLERAIMASCQLPDCEPPIELGIAHCEQGKCARGRPAPTSTDHESCWDYRETWLEADGAANATASSTLKGITPHLAIAPAAAGTLVLEVDWPMDCVDCRLLISEHNSGMSQLIVAKSIRTQAKRNGVEIVRERLELPVTPGPYHMVGMAGADVDVFLRADLRDAVGERGRVTRHGVGWQRMCEG